MKKILTLALILLIAIGALTACNKRVDASINGTSLSDYVIVYSESEPRYNKTAAEYIQSCILARTGAKLEIVTDAKRAAEHEIIVGETTRSLSASLDADCDGLEFAILADDGSVAMEGDYFVIAAAAYYFVENYIKDDVFAADVPMTVSINEPIKEAPKNFIFLIGDGMGLYQTKMFDYLDRPTSYKGDGEDIFYGYMLPYQGEVRTNSLSEGVPTDSAAAGTAMATGYKTYNKYIGMDKDMNAVMSLTELAASLGKATAVMSTEGITGATPAAFSAHASNRGNEFEIEESQRNLTGTILQSVTNSYGDGAGKLIDNVIAEVKSDEDGFFLMYEEAHIDKNASDGNLDATFKSLIRFNQAIGKFMEFAFYNPDTFVIITADHETGDLKPDDSGSLGYNTEEHTSANVLMFAYGEGADVFNGKTIENVQIPKTIAKIWGTSDFGDPSNGFDALGE